jgi:predicted transcriptional regulator
MGTEQPKPFDALIKFRATTDTKTRLDRIAAKKGKKPAEVYREAAQEKADREERLLKRKDRELATK